MLTIMTLVVNEWLLFSENVCSSQTGESPRRLLLLRASLPPVQFQWQHGAEFWYFLAYIIYCRLNFKTRWIESNLITNLSFLPFAHFNKCGYSIFLRLASFDLIHRWSWADLFTKFVIIKFLLHLKLKIIF